MENPKISLRICQTKKCATTTAIRAELSGSAAFHYARTTFQMHAAQTKKGFPPGIFSAG
ncbi:hypothetical protein CEV31_2482 [Brucella thiophenivorans]|uniref:Uncharacterized protein n=1 Tax=Brucella thiophenivorans TaxID=571255 RepID=A0A256FWK3_9HYPH|nr:hypothetical protein CEV31_2482 [Brucella thiophenivorans]